MGDVIEREDPHSVHPTHAPEISVVMPNYNGVRFIARSIESALKQSFRSIELLVVDDGSSDGSTDLVRSISDSRLRLIEQSHEGVCAARNRGIRAATGRYVAFLDSDDSWDPECLAKLHSALSATNRAALAYCGWRNVTASSPHGAPFVPPDYEVPEKLELWIRNTRWPIHAALTRREAIVHAGAFDPRFPTSEDFLLWLKIVADHRIVRVPEVLATYYHHDGPRATNNRVRMAFNHLDAQRAFLHQRPAVALMLGQDRVRELTLGELLVRGYECYWQRDLDSARRIFRRVMRAGYGRLSDWTYMLPATLPIGLHLLLLRIRDSWAGRGKSRAASSGTDVNRSAR